MLCLEAKRVRVFPTGSLQIESGSNLHEIHLVVVESETEIDGPVPSAIAPPPLHVCLFHGNYKTCT